MPGRLLTLEEAAHLLAVSPRTVQRRIREGKLTAYKVAGNSTRVDYDELAALITPAGGDTK